MTHSDQLDAIHLWQSDGIFHPLTCAVKSRHELLEGRVVGGNVRLVCPTCGWIQSFVPSIVYERWQKEQVK